MVLSQNYPNKVTNTVVKSLVYRQTFVNNLGARYLIQKYLIYSLMLTGKGLPNLWQISINVVC